MRKTGHITYNMLVSSDNLLITIAKNSNNTKTDIMKKIIKDTCKEIDIEITINNLNKKILKLCNFIQESYYDNDYILDMLSDIDIQETKTTTNLCRVYIHEKKKKCSFRLSPKNTKDIKKIKEYYRLKTDSDTLSYIIQNNQLNNAPKHELIKNILYLQNIYNYIADKYGTKESKKINTEVNQLWQKIYQL